MSKQIESKTIFSAVDRISPVVNKITGSMTQLSNKMSKVGGNLSSFGGNTLFKSGAGLAGMFYSLLRPAMQVEKSMSNVKKVFGEEKFGSFTAFQSDLTSLANNLKLSLVDIADLSSNLPIMAMDSKKELLNVIELTRHAMETMDMDAVRASSSVKTFFNSVGTDYKKTKIALGSINELGNLHGVTNADLIDFGAMGALGTGISAGMQAKEVMALGSAYLSLGQTAERAKTSTEHLLKAMTISGGAKAPQRNAFKMIGMTPERVAESFASKDADKGHVNTIVAVLNKINSLPMQHREGVFAKILGLEGLGATKLLSKNLDMLIQRFKDVQDNTKLMNSLSDEYAKKTENSTFFIEKTFNRLKNLKDLMIISLLPTFKKVSEYIDIWADKYEQLSPETKKMIGDGVLLTAGMLTLGVAVGGVSYALGGLVTAMGAVTRAGKLMAGVDALGMLGGLGGMFGGKKDAKGLIPANSNKFIKTMKIPHVMGKGVGVDLLGGFDVKPANSNGKIGFLTKISRLLDNIGKSNGIKALGSLGAFLGGGALAIGASSLGAIVISGGILIGVCAGIYKNFKNIGTELIETKNLLGELFGIEGQGALKTFGGYIASFIGKAIEKTIALINKGIEGLLYMKNLASGLNFDEAYNKTEYQLFKLDPSRDQELQQSVNDNIKGKERAYLIDHMAKLKFQQPIVNLKVDTSVVYNKDGTVDNVTTTKNLDTGTTSTVVNRSHAKTLYIQGVR